MVWFCKISSIEINRKSTTKTSKMLSEKLYWTVVSSVPALLHLGKGAFYALFIISGIAGLLSIWRIWTFTVRPALNPQEPKEVPYWVPRQ